MIKFPDKRKIIIALFVLTLILLMINIILTKIYPDAIKKEPDYLPPQEIKARFLSALASLGVQNDWITEGKLTKKFPSTLKYYFRIKVPEDLPISLVIKEVENSFNDNEAVINSQEEKVNGKNLIKIFSDGDLVFQAQIDYGERIKRNTGRIGIFLSNFENVGEPEDSILLSAAELFTVILIPSEKNVLTYKRIMKFGKATAILLNDDVNDTNFKLGSSVSEQRIKNSVKEIFSKFPAASMFFIDKNSELSSSSVFKLISNEFIKRKVELLDKGLVKDVNSSLSENIEEKFEKEIKKLKNNDSMLLSLETSDYFKIQPIIVKYRKIGYKFVNASEIIAD
jgi:hypothetical protein